MSPEARRNFEAEWAALSRRLRLLLARKHVPSCQHDDLIQETALRLVSMWDTVDRRRDLWPLTVTIALNLLRDRGRAGDRDDLVQQVPDMKALTDVETAGIARMELAQVRAAMDQLSESHRSILMREIGAHAASALPDGAADKMLRMRARRKLRSALGKVSGLAAWRFRRLGDLFEGLVVVREAGFSAASCAFCLALGVGGTLLVPPGLMREATAVPTVASHRSALTDGSVLSMTGAGHLNIRDAWDEARAAGSVARAAQAEETARRTGTSSKGSKIRNGQTDADGGLVPGVPVPDGDDQVTKPGTIQLSPGGGGDPLGSGGDDATTVPPVPEPPPGPSPPAPPTPPTGGDDSLLSPGDLVDELL